MTCKKHELYEEEYTFNMKGEMVLVCQKCYEEVPITEYQRGNQ